MRFLIFAFTLSFIGISANAQQTLKSDFAAGSVIVKLKHAYADKCHKSAIAIPALDALLASSKIQQTEKLFPNHKTILKTKSTTSHVDLSTIYRLQFDASKDPFKIIRQLQNSAYVEYVEPEYINQLAFTPADSLNNQQWYLNAIKAYEAWDIQKGDTSVVIAIVDTGSDLDHEDLVNEFAYNYDDPINGVDDDNDGYIDNFNGWDVANNDNNTTFGNSGHGTNVAGIASASADNNVGISGCGFNSKILSIRIDSDVNGALTGAYDGVVYAADHGAFIINNSWGSYSYSRLAQDVVNYAAINKGALVICAVGNGPFTGPNVGVGTEQRFYPAAYENVFSVGSLVEGDTVKESSNYGYWVEVFAPGGKMLTTDAAGNYGINGGTSMAAPVVAGVAALVKSEFPTYTAEQVKQKIMNTSDDIYAVNESRYQNKLGEGRINAFRALSDNTTPGIAFKNKVISDNNDETFLPGDTLRIYGDFKNYLANASNVTISIESLDNAMQVIDGTTSIGQLNSMESKNNVNDPFLLLIKSGVNYNQLLDLELSITADNYAVKRFFDVNVNPSYITINENNLSVTLPSNGKTGYAGKNTNLGEGIRYLGGTSLLYEGTFMLGNDTNYLVNSFRNDVQDVDDDFKTVSSIRRQANSEAIAEAFTIYNDGNFSGTPNLEIEQRNYFFNTTETENSAIYVYAIRNVSSSEIRNLHAGIALDWDIVDFEKNKIYYDASRAMGVSYSSDSNVYCGVQALTQAINNTHYAIDNISGGNGGINALDGFTDAEKFQSISNMRDSAGFSTPQGNDIIDVNAIGPFSIQADSLKIVAFSVTIANSKNNLEEEADSVAKLFQELSLNLTSPKLPKFAQSIIYPNPTNNHLSLNINLESAENLQVEVIDASGKLIYSENQFLLPGAQQINLSVASWKTGVYFLKIKGDNLNFQNTFVVAR